MAHAPRNSFIAPGVRRYSRSAVYAKKALYKHPKPAVQAADKTAAADKTVELKGGQKRVVPANKASRFYPAEDVPQPKKSRKSAKAATVRSSITPGTVLILLAGRYRGKRVVCVKTLESGLLLVSGPYKVNGVPLRRVNQAYVIATSTKLDISAAQVCTVTFGGFQQHVSLTHRNQIDEKFNDAYFTKKTVSNKKGSEEEFFEGEQKKKVYPETKANDQKNVDKALLEAVSKVPHLRQYLASTFSLKKGQFPHQLKF
ncbi:ribosomal protein L6e-domain-containing protein [Umbelopsis sp. PMI_123]|nr:ribosomal protein L6e-domain-containing protein [Umbelopsis sp. PMI_123]